MILRNGLVVLPGEEAPQLLDIVVQKGVIAELTQNAPPTKDHADYDMRGKFIFPGAIDPHVHFDDPGYTYREDFLTGTSFAAQGGVTTVIDMPCTSIPPVTDRRSLTEKLEHINQKAIVDYGLFGGVSQQSFDEDFPNNLISMHQDILGVKTYFLSGMDSFRHLDHYSFKRVLIEAKNLNIPVLLHAEDRSYVLKATEHEMEVGDSPRHYYNSRPETAENLAVISAMLLQRETDADLHIVHIGSAKAASLLSPPNFTGETCAHYLEFNIEDFESIGSPLKCAPVVKSSTNAFDLWGLLRNKMISFVASDHAPSPKEEKNTGSIWTDYGGMPGTGLMMPFMFSEGYTKNLLSLDRLTEVTSLEAAKRYRIDDRKGSIELGKDADFCIIDPDMTWTIRGKEFLSKGKITPFEGREFVGRVVATFVRGRVVYILGKGIATEPGWGQLLMRRTV